MNYRQAVIALALAILASCSPYAKYQKVEALPEITVTRELQLDIVIITTTGQTVPGVHVVAKTAKSQDGDVTNSDGRVTLHLTPGLNEAIDLHFTSATFDWMDTLAALPPDRAFVRVIFKVDERQRISVGAIEY